MLSLLSCLFCVRVAIPSQDFEEACVLDGFKAAWLFLSDSSTLRARVQKQYKDKVCLSLAHWEVRPWTAQE